MDIAIIGLSITSSWGNGHATTYRSLVKGLAERGHRVVFYECDRPWYRDHRDLSGSPHAQVVLYRSLPELYARYASRLRTADLVIVGSYVPEGALIGEWLAGNITGVLAFYDIDTPVTLAGLQTGGVDYITRALVRRFDLYLSFTGGPTLRRLERDFGARRARPLYCAVDPDVHRPDMRPPRWDLGYLGTYSADRQPTLSRLLLKVAAALPERKFVVGGPNYADARSWPPNVEWVQHVAPEDHAAFYGAQRFTLNATRADMRAAGYSPSVRLFEAAACGVPIVSDKWTGMEEFFTPGEEILTVVDTRDVLDVLTRMPEERRRRIAEAARRRVLAEHTGSARARDLENFVREARDGRRQRMVKVPA